MPNDDFLARDQRAARLDTERAGASRLLDTYRTAWEGIRSQLDILLGKIADAEAAGETVSRS